MSPEDPLSTTAIRRVVGTNIPKTVRWRLPSAGERGSHGVGSLTVMRMRGINITEAMWLHLISRGQGAAITKTNGKSGEQPRGLDSQWATELINDMLEALGTRQSAANNGDA